MSDARSSDVSEYPPREPRTIVLCFDGTHGEYGRTNTNVVKFFGLLCKDRPDQQVAYYQAGIGTYFAAGIVSPVCTYVASLLDEAFAWYLDAHVMDGYKYLMDNYRLGDKICLFGFSRGAFTARALAGMLQKVGLLPRDNLQQVKFAYKAYQRGGKEGIKLAAGFKKTFSQHVTVEFVGVWDTVQSTGVLINRTLPFTNSNKAIRVFRHALSLDEHRARFRPNFYHRPAEPAEATDLESAMTESDHAVKPILERLLNKTNSDVQPHQTEGHGPLVDAAQQSGVADEVASDGTEPCADLVAEAFPCTDVLEVWFAGCHGDIGGGNVQDDVKVSLAQITLHWMVEQVIQSRCGILFDNDELARIGFTVLPLSPQLSPVIYGGALPSSNNALSISEVETARSATDPSACVVQESVNDPDRPASGPETYPEHSDAIAPLFDRLRMNKLWWLAEIVPSCNAWQDTDGVWHEKWSINFGRGRLIPFQKPKFHHTVRERMDYKPLNYTPRAIYGHDEVYV